MPEDPRSDLLVAVLEQLSPLLPPQLDSASLRQFIVDHCTWDHEFPDPVQRSQFTERVYRALLGKIQTLSLAEDQKLCPQCGKSLPDSQAVSSAVVCTACGFQSQGLFSMAPSSPAAEVDRGKLPIRFELKDFLGEGAFGKVYQAWDSKLQRDVAIKIPKVERLDRDIFLREARAASRLSHPNIVRIYDVGEIGNMTFIVSDLIKGTTLGRWAATTKPGIKTACEVMLKIAQAMQHAHQSDVIHRDLKPGNILIDDRLEPVVLDFGLSHSRTLQFDSIAKTGAPIGTPAFMSPEQVQGQLDRIDTWTDVYAMGVILYQLLTGNLPFTGASESIYNEIIHRPVVSPRKWNPKIAPALAAITLKAMEKAPERRYATAHDFAADLRRFLAGEPVMAYRKWDTRVAAAYSRRYFMSAVALVLAGGLFGVWAWWHRERQVNNPLVAVTISSQPAQADLTWVRLDPETLTWDEPNRVQNKAGAATYLPPGFYKVIARSGDESFEVFRTVPSQKQSPIAGYRGIGPLPHRYWLETDGVNELLPIRMVPAAEVQTDMVFVLGGEIRFSDNPLRSPMIKNLNKTVGRFFIDKSEVTYGDLLQVFPNFQAPEVAAPEAACLIDWDIAVAYAERVGKNVPELWELLYAATNGGTTLFPWGDHFVGTARADRLDQLKLIDETVQPAGIERLVTGVGEWTVDHALVFNPGANRLMPLGPDKFQVIGWDDWSESGMNFIQQSETIPMVVRQIRSQTDDTGLRCVRRFAK
jgi:hypothetical protein